MNENQRTRGAKRRKRVIDPEQKRTTGEQARVNPSVSIPGFSPDELKMLSEKLELLDVAMDDWSPVRKNDDSDGMVDGVVDEAEKEMDTE